MKFRTEVHIEDSQRKIGIEDQIFSIGSCFASEISNWLSTGQLQTLDNPFGTVFNPFSINKAIKKIHDAEFYTQADLITYNQQFISLDHHTSFDTPFIHQTLEKINQKIEAANLFLQTANWVIVTYGSSFIYEFLPQKSLVANCHKIPQKFFEKRLLSHEEISNAMVETVMNLQDICPENVQILFTISPVRHTKDGIAENQWSKSKLFAALHETIHQFSFCHYVPIYEIMMDDLRDYRFYKDDMVHPSAQALKYIFEKFSNAYLEQPTQEFILENEKIIQAKNHRPSNENHPNFLEFKQKLEDKIAQQQGKVRHKIFND